MPGWKCTNRTKDHIHAILDSAAKGGFAAGSIEQKVGDFYASGMDSVTIDKLGYEPLKPTLQQIDAIKDAKGVIQFVAQQTVEGNNILIAVGIGADAKNSVMNIAALQQYGLGLPDRDYYFKNDPATLGVVKAYQAYIQKLFTLTGDDSVNAAKKNDGGVQPGKNSLRAVTVPMLNCATRKAITTKCPLQRWIKRCR